MARPATGSVRVRTRNGHSETTLRFSAYGQRYEIPAGTDDAIRARGRLDEILDQIRRGIWQPPTKTKPKPPRAAEPRSASSPTHGFSKSRRLSPSVDERTTCGRSINICSRTSPRCSCPKSRSNRSTSIGRQRCERASSGQPRSTRRSPAWARSWISLSNTATSLRIPHAASADAWSKERHAADSSKPIRSSRCSMLRASWIVRQPTTGGLVAAPSWRH